MTTIPWCFPDKPKRSLDMGCSCGWPIKAVHDCAWKEKTKGLKRGSPEWRSKLAELLEEARKYIWVS